MPSNNSISLPFVHLRALCGFTLFEDTGLQPDSFCGTPA